MIALFGWLGLLPFQAQAQFGPGDAALPGGVSVIIQPPEALADGARWSVDGRAEQSSGAHEIGLFPGYHTVQFRNLIAWQEPDAIDVTVVGARETTVTATYRRLPSFYFRAMPGQTARPGKPLEFLIRSSDPDDPTSPPPGSTLLVTASPQPSGAISFDPVTGRFSYAPAAADRLPFTITVSPSQGGATGTTLITPANQLAPEDTVIEYDRPLPDASSRDYITITQTTNAPDVFNDDPTNKTINVEISGETLVLATDHPSRLHRQFSDRENIKTFKLFADRVIIRSPLILPQTRVTIRARELRFEGDGSINTTPKPRLRKPAAILWEDNLTRGIDGDAGHDGGDIEVFVERFHSDPGQSARFVMNGGAGGPAGEGRNGRSELTLPFLSADWNKLMARCGIPVCGTSGGSSVIVYLEDHFGTEPADICGRKVTVHGENAIPSGRPGRGGNGGVLRSTLNLGGFAQFPGGQSGARGADYVGGALSARQFIYRVVRTTFKNGQEIVSTSDSPAPKTAALGATAPFATSPVGTAGRVEVVPDAGAWLHSFAVRNVIQFAKDAYLNGHIAETRSLLDEFRLALLAHPLTLPEGTNVDDVVFSEKVSRDQLLAETEALLHRIDSNLDYFGNPAGWVPMLSFEANLVAFQQEVEQSIRVLYLAYWLNNAATNLDAAILASERAKDNLAQEFGQMLNSLNEARDAIPRLHDESDAIVVRIAGVRGQLASKLSELLERARQNVEERHKVPFWKQAIGTLSVAADLIPIGQPTVGRIGSGLSLITKFDPEKPLESAATLTPKAFEIFSEKNITFCFETNALPKGTNSTSNTSTNSTGSGTNAVKQAKQQETDRMTECGKFLGAELKELSDLFKDVQVSKEELAAELAKLKAADPVFQALTQELTDLNKQKEEFAQQLAATLQAVLSLTSGLAENRLSIHELENRLDANLAALDQGALLHIKEMERRAKDRLLKYQYFVAKSFQYRQLKPYAGNLQLTRLLEKFQVLVEAGNSHTLSDTEFDQLKFLFVDELRDIVAQSLDNFNSPEVTLTNTFQLTADELRELNTTRHLTINLKERGLLGSRRDSVRIVNLRARAMPVHPVGGAIGSHALVNVDFVHSGISRLTSAGKTFLFRHYQTEAVNPIVWNAQFDGLAGTLQNSEPSPAQQSLLALLLNLNASQQSVLELFSLPAAWADIHLTKEVQTDNGIGMVIDQLQIEFKYSFFNNSGNQRELNVQVTDDLSPVIMVSQQDINGRQDGQGDFLRVFAPFSQVTLTAPASFGQFTFDRWLINGQAGPASQASVQVTMAADTKLEAKYRVATFPVTGPTLLPANAPEGQVGFSFLSAPGTQYTIEQTPRLANPVWTPVETRTGTGGAILFTRPVGTNATAFFRLRID